MNRTELQLAFEMSQYALIDPERAAILTQSKSPQTKDLPATQPRYANGAFDTPLRVARFGNTKANEKSEPRMRTYPQRSGHRHKPTPLHSLKVSPAFHCNELLI